MRVMDQQLEAYDRATRDVMGSNPPTPLDADIDELIDIGIALFDAAKASVLRRNEQINTGRRSFQIEDARQFDIVYQRLSSAFDRLATAVKDKQGAGLWADGADRLKEARRELHLLASLPADRIARSERDLQEGKGRPLEEVVDELRRHNHA